MKAIKSCPFCGGIPDIIKPFELDEHMIKANVYAVICTKCLVKTKTYNTKEIAIYVWNKRVVSDKYYACKIKG